MIIVLEGADGAGKTTQSLALAEALVRVGERVTVIPHPKGTKIGLMLYECLKEASNQECEVAIACAMHASVQPLLLEHRDSNNILIMDRYWPSTLVYQNPTGLMRVRFMDSVKTWVAPDLMIWLKAGVSQMEDRKSELGRDPTESKFESDALLRVTRYGDVFAGINKSITIDGDRQPSEITCELLNLVLNLKDAHMHSHNHGN